MAHSIDYDERFDVLYVRPNPYTPCYCDGEMDDEVAFFRSFRTDEVVGMVVEGFRANGGEVKDTPFQLSEEELASARAIAYNGGEEG